MKRKAVQFCKAGALALGLGFSGLSIAGPTVSAGYLELIDLGGVDLGAIYGSVGYEFDLGPNVSVTPEFRAGFGVKDDTVREFGVNVDLELTRLLGFATRFTYTADNGLYAYGTTSYVNYEAKASAQGLSEKEDTWEFGIGAGVGFLFTPQAGFEVQYENVDSEDVVSAAFRFRF